LHCAEAALPQGQTSSPICAALDDYGDGQIGQRAAEMAALADRLVSRPSVMLTTASHACTAEMQRKTPLISPNHIGKAKIGEFALLN
jgi:hypothetical protein